MFILIFPKDRNCEICKRTKITRAPCRRRKGEAVPRADNFGDLITADHRVLSDNCESRNNHRYAVVVQDLATQWIQAYPCKNKTSQETQRSLHKFLEPERKPKVIYSDNSLEFGKACEDLSWNHCTWPEGWGPQGRRATGGGGLARVPNLRVCKHLSREWHVDEENYGNDEGEVQAGAVDIGTIWNIGGVEINKVQKMEVENDPKTKAIEITVDSGAGASCWPAKLLKKIPMKEKDKGVRFKAANGTELKYYGTKNIKFQSEGGICDMKFHVTDTTKPLASAAAIAKMGNRVVLEDGLGKSYIENVATGKKIHLRESGGTYVLDADCLADAAIFSRLG